MHMGKKENKAQQVQEHLHCQRPHLWADSTLMEHLSQRSQRCQWRAGADGTTHSSDTEHFEQLRKDTISYNSPQQNLAARKAPIVVFPVWKTSKAHVASDNVWNPHKQSVKAGAFDQHTCETVAGSSKMLESSWTVRGRQAGVTHHRRDGGIKMHQASSNSWEQPTFSSR